MSECTAMQRVLADWPRAGRAEARVVVACSGGPDSQALLDILATQRHALNITALWAVGIDHGLRPEAAAELDGAAALARRHGIAFARVGVTVSRRGNIMQNARRARYAALRQFAEQRGATAVAVGHTADDQLETIVHHLIRGCGITGAGGMRPKRGMLIRPLLQVTRAQILAHLAMHAIARAEDPTNADARYTRTRIRTRVAPALRAIQPAAARHMVQFAERAREDDALLMRAARRRLARAMVPPGAASPTAVAAAAAAAATDGSLCMTTLAAAPRPIAMRMLTLWLRGHGVARVDSGVLEALWCARHAERHEIVRRGLRVTASRGRFWWREQSHPWKDGEIGLPIPGNIAIPGWNGALEVAIGPGGPEILQQSRNKPSMAVAFDADRLHFDLGLRLWRSSDKLRPFGLDGTMKVGDLFTNTKIPRPLRAIWPLVTHGESVLWVVGLRRGSDAPVTRDTRRVVSLTFQGALPWSAC